MNILILNTLYYICKKNIMIKIHYIILFKEENRKFVNFNIIPCNYIIKESELSNLDLSIKHNHIDLLDKNGYVNFLFGDINSNPPISLDELRNKWNINKVYYPC